jgi:multicomponent Na+:H+ antiporter subunit C
VTDFGLSQNMLYTLAAGILILMGFATVILKRNLIKILLGFVLMNSGAQLLIVAVGFVPGRTAPIVDSPGHFRDMAAMDVDPGLFVDPIPQAIVLTAVVIGVGVTALMLAYAVRLYGVHKTLDVTRFRTLKW